MHRAAFSPPVPVSIVLVTILASMRVFPVEPVLAVIRGGVAVSQTGPSTGRLRLLGALLSDGNVCGPSGD
jgi:hypothetical protein